MWDFLVRAMFFLLALSKKSSFNRLTSKKSFALNIVPIHKATNIIRLLVLVLTALSLDEGAQKPFSEGDPATASPIAERTPEMTLHQPEREREMLTWELKPNIKL